MRQCEATDKVKNDIIRIKNNQAALTDTIINYKNKLGYNIGEIRGLKLRISELNDSIKFEKNKPPVTIIEYETEIVENIIEIPVYSFDTIIGNYHSIINFSDSAKWKKSSRVISGMIPFRVKGDSLITGSASLYLKQNVWLTASILEDKKTKEVFVELKTDYPNLIFNDAQGILIDQSEISTIKRKSRKTFSLGLQIGCGFNSNGFTPYVGIGLNYSPKFLQW
jgi:hypothetical protein